MEDGSIENPLQRSRLIYALLIVSVLASGLLWRSHYLSLPPFMTKYGGDALWSLAVFFGFGFMIRRSSISRLSMVSLGFTWVIEFSQIYHAVWIDSIRETRIGHLILGSTFNAPDLLAYAVGIALGVMIERVCWKKLNQRCQ